jgi:hypothetical protein
MLEFDDVVDVTEPVLDIVYLSLCLFYVADRAVGECPSSREVIAGIVYAGHFSAEAAVWISFRGRLRQARLPRLLLQRPVLFVQISLAPTRRPRWFIRLRYPSWREAIGGLRIDDRVNPSSIAPVAG